MKISQTVTSLTRCLCGYTQNSNESFNSTIWLIISKHLNSGQKIVEIAAYTTAGMFNEGYSAILSVMQLLNLNIDQQCKMFTDIADTRRIEGENKRQAFSRKEAHTARRLHQMHQKKDWYIDQE